MAVTLVEFSSVEAMAEAAAAALAEGVEHALTQRGRASLAVSGGNTPRFVLPRLAAKDLDWSRLAVTLIDERWVAPDHGDSNEGLARRFLLDEGAGEASLIGLKTIHADPEAGLAGAEARLETLSWPLDVSFLGMGEDGHVASLFPKEDWTADGRLLAVPATADRQARMSFTPSTLLDTRRIVLVLSGATKRSVFDQALQPGPATDLPIRIVLHQEQVPVTVLVTD